MKATLSLFDANAHPTVSGGWPGEKPRDSGFPRFARELKKNRYRGACAVGVWGLEGYEHEKFIDLCNRTPGKLVPIAGFFPGEAGDIPGELAAIKGLGYRGIKLHPKEPAIALSDPRMSETLKTAAELDLRVFLCTYLHTSLEELSTRDPLFETIELLKTAPHARVLLVHGGGVRLLEYSELVRFNPNLLLDLSLTLMKYRSSSLDLDLRFLFENFDRRICIGTDFPEYSHAEVRARFASLARGLTREKRANIAYKNIEGFLGLGD